jgi:hypothetical protein
MIALFFLTSFLFGTASSSAVDFPCLEIKEEEGTVANWIVRDGVPIKGFDENGMFSRFKLFLNESNQLCKGETKVRPGKVDITALHNATEIVYVLGSFQEIDDIDGNAKISQTEQAIYNLQYTCTNEAFVYSYQIDVTFEFPGADYKNITVTWVKHCWPGGTPPPAPAPTKKKMSGAGKFFLVVFVLALVFFIVGAGLNFIMFNKTGLDIIPCIGVCYSCRDKSSGTQGYHPSPETNNSAKQENKDDNEYGAVFQ